MDPSLVERVLDLAMAIQQIPAPTFAEGERAKFIEERFISNGVKEVETDKVGNVYAHIPGQGDRLPLVVSAHMDTVFPDTVELSLRRNSNHIYGPGIGDNAIGVAGLFSILWSLDQDLTKKRQKGPAESARRTKQAIRYSIPGDLWLVANVGEEGLGDLRGMRAIVDRFQDKPLAYIALEGMALGQIYHRGLAVQRYRIAVRTHGGHSWVDHGHPSAIHELSSLVNRLLALPIPHQPRTSLNVGVVSGGTSVNTIASSAEMEIDLRSEDSRVLEELVERVNGVVRKADQPGVKIEIEEIGQRPAGEISRRHPLVQLAMRILREIDMRPYLNIGSTDANIPLSMGLPGICVGITTGSGAHTTDEYINIPPVAQGLEQLVRLVKAAYLQL
jgi:tripeptide aminopeptidase